MKKIIPEKINPSNFQPFGSLLMQPEREQDIETHWLQYWHNMVDMSSLGGKGLLGFMRVKRVPILCEKLLMLFNSIEMYVSLDGKPSIIFVAPGKDGVNEPDLTRLQAFMLEGGASVAVERGIWHWSPFPLTETADFALGLKNNVILQDKNGFSVNDEEIQYFDLIEPVGIEL